jgi:serine phosphatase RsbU (regulator of sigma subunit)
VAIDFSRCCAIFEFLSREELDYLLSQSSIIEYPPGTMIFLEGDTSRVFSILLEGHVEIIKSIDTDLERLIKVLGPGEFIGEMSLVYKDRSRTASARARSSAQMLEVPGEEFELLVKSNPRLAYHLMRVMIERVTDNEIATVQDLQTKNVLLAQSLSDLREAQDHLIAREKIETELATAHQIQMRMLPETLPALSGWALDAHWQAAHAVSGDFYDFIPLPDGRLALVIGDVTDKGVPAALLMAVTRSMVRTAARLEPSPGTLLAHVNEILCMQIPLNRFATCQVAFLNPRTGEIELANAGHPLPLIAHQGNALEIRATGLALGIFPGMEYEVITAQLEPGDTLLFYSDGLSEARDPQGNLLQSSGAKRLLLQGINQDLRLIPYLLDELGKFRGKDETEDDITLITLKRA